MVLFLDEHLTFTKYQLYPNLAILTFWRTLLIRPWLISKPPESPSLLIILNLITTHFTIIYVISNKQTTKYPELSCSCSAVVRTSPSSHITPVLKSIFKIPAHTTSFTYKVLKLPELHISITWNAVKPSCNTRSSSRYRSSLHHEAASLSLKVTNHHFWYGSPLLPNAFPISPTS